MKLFCHILIVTFMDHTEYGMGSQASKEGDVYSYGILVLEMFTSRRPTNEIFKDGLNLHTFVKNALMHEQLSQIVDPTVVLPSDVRQTAMADIGEDIYNSNDDDKDQREVEGGGVGCIMEMPTQMNDMDHIQSCLLAVMKMALGCSLESPGDRINMRDATRELHQIKEAFLRRWKNI